MAFRRSVTARAKFFFQQQRVSVPFSLTDRENDDDRSRRRQTLPNYRVSDYHRRGDNVGRFRGLLGDRRFATSAGLRPAFVRHMSSDGVGKKAVEAVAPVANEVAAAAIGVFPVDTIQNLIGHVHTFTGLNWWGLIVVTTVLIRTLLLPITIYQTKVANKFSVIRHQVVAWRQEMKGHRVPHDDKDYEGFLERYVPDVNERKRFAKWKMAEVLYENGVYRCCNWAAYTVTVYVICKFILAMDNMAGKIVSFQNGGPAFIWFADLSSTPDSSMSILPLFTALTFWTAMKCHGGGGTYSSRVLVAVAALTIPLAASTPKAILCFWITSNLYGLVYAMVIKNGSVKKKLGIPMTTTAPRPGYFSYDILLAVQPPAFGELLPPILLLAKSIADII